MTSGISHNSSVTVSDPQQIDNLIDRLRRLQIDAQNLVSSFLQTEQGRQVFMLTYLRLHDEVERLLHDAGQPISSIEQLQTARHRSLVADQVPSQSLYREVEGEVAILRRVLDDLAAELSNAAAIATTPTPPGIAITSDTGKKYTYDTADLLGRGLFSEVYGGSDEAGRPVAIKRLGIRQDSTRRRVIDRQQVERELEVASRLGSNAASHVMPIWDSVHRDDELLIVMPRAAYSAADLISRQGPLGDRDAKELVRQVALAMTELAAAVVVHRDIKPGNILWYEDRWRLADFGISRIMSAATATYTFRGTGTFEYMAPEAFLNPSIQTVASDLYALGCVGYEAVTGRKAFDGEDLQRLHATHIPVLPDGTDPVLAKVITLLLAKSPDQRPPDARRVLELLAPRDGLTAGQRSLQQLSEAAAKRTLQRGSQEAALLELHERLERARTALGAIWRDLVDYVREAVPEAESTEDVDRLVDNRTLIVGDLRLRLRLDESPRYRPGGAIVVAEIFISSVGDTQPKLAANLVCLWRNDRPEWRLVQ